MEDMKKLWRLGEVVDALTAKDYTARGISHELYDQEMCIRDRFNTAKPQYIETIWGVGYRFKV